jgi:hypothetical protein
MKTFIKLSIIFSIPIMIFLIVSEILLRNIPNNYSYKKHYLDTKSNEIEVLYLGSSHVYYGINPEYSKFKSFNASNISQSLNFDLRILEKYRDNWPNLKYIVIPVDYFSMYTSLEQGIEKWRVKNYSIYFDINISSNYKNNFEILNGKFSDDLTRLKSYYLLNGSTDVTCNKLGWGTTNNSKKSKDLIETGKVAMARHTFESNDLIFKNNVNTLNAIIKFAKQKKLKIIFFTSPAFHSYVDLLNHDQLFKTVNIITKISSENSNSVYYNLLKNKSFVADDFYDADHLNEKGAKKLTFIIDSLINK